MTEQNYKNSNSNLTVPIIISMMSLAMQRCGYVQQHLTRSCASSTKIVSTPSMNIENQFLVVHELFINPTRYTVYVPFCIPFRSIPFHSMFHILHATGYFEVTTQYSLDMCNCSCLITTK